MPRPRDIDAYLAPLPDDQRAALQRVRELVQKAAPAAEESISYGLPAFRQGKALVAFGATKSHCAFYPLSPAVLASFGAELAGYSTSKGTIRFRPEKPLPAALIRRLVKARLAEIGAGPAAPAPPAQRTAARKPAAKKPPAGKTADALPPLSAPARRALEAARIKSLAGLAKKRRGDVAALHGMGPSALRALDAALAQAGRTWRDP